MYVLYLTILYLKTIEKKYYLLYNIQIPSKGAFNAEFFI